MAKKARKRAGRGDEAGNGHATVATTGAKDSQGGEVASTSAAKSAKRANEIDDLFSSLDTVKAVKAAKTATAKGEDAPADTSNRHGKGRKDEAVNAKNAKKPAKLVGSKDDIFGTGEAEARKRTEEGYKIYTEDELGLGASSKNAGYTKDCPFDCQCCF